MIEWRARRDLPRPRPTMSEPAGVPSARHLFASTKFAAPRTSPTYVPRPGLVRRLDAGRDAGVTLLIGLPGSGKTTAVAAWLRDHPALPSVWLGCDPRDGEPRRFWTGLVRALRLRWPDLFVEASDLLDDEPDYSDVATTVVNDLARIDGDAAVVIDDCHLAPASMAHLGEVLERLPDGVHFVLTTRSHVDLPIARLRVHGILNEIRQDELSASEQEIGLVVEKFGVRLVPASLHRLTRRTEGWMAAVQLAALSMRGLEDPDELVGRLAASTRLVTDYLIQEVLERQPPDLREFLTETSVLGQFDASLCRDVTGRPNADVLLDDALRRNLFLIPLSDGSFRFHELFADLLRLRLGSSDAERQRQLHRAAAVALERRGVLAGALRHYLASGDDQAAFLVVRDRVSDAYYADGGDAIRSMMAELPIDWVAQDAARMIAYAAIMFLAGQAEEAVPWVERLGRLPPAELAGYRTRYEVVASLVERGRGNAVAALGHAEQARLHGDRASEPWLDWLPAATLQAHLWLDDIPAATDAFAESQRQPAFDSRFNELVMPAHYSWVCVVEGNLREAERLAAATLSTAKRLGLLKHPSLGAAFASLGWICYERGQADGAEELLDRALAINERARPPAALVYAVALGRVWLSLGRVDDALEMAARAGTFVAAPTDSILLDLVADLQGRAALALGSPDQAEERARRMRPSRRRIVLEARTALARGKPLEAAAFLADAAFPPTTRRTRLHDLALRACCACRLGDKAFPSLISEAIDVGEEAGLMAALRDDLVPIADAVWPYLPVHARGFARSLGMALSRAISAAGTPDGTQIDALSPQERRVLRYLRSRLTQREIAQEIHVSTNTVKTHVRAIFRKLDVSTRSEAVERARRVGILR